MRTNVPFIEERDLGNRRPRSLGRIVPAAFVLGGLLLVPAAVAETNQPAGASPRKSPYATARLTTGAKKYYEAIWGVDILGVKPVSSGTLLRFSYRVVDAKKATTLNDKKASPYLYDQATRAKLVVPTMEKIGQLRQSSTPEEGREYWMLFSNKGNLVKPGSRVDVVVGAFRAEGLIVQANEATRETVRRPPHAE